VNLQLVGVEWDGHWGFNWILSNGLRSTQVSEEKGAMTEHKLPIKNGLRKVKIYYIECLEYKSLYGLKFFDTKGDLMLEVGKFDQDNKIEVELAPEEVIVGVIANIRDTKSCYY